MKRLITFLILGNLQGAFCPLALADDVPVAIRTGQPAPGDGVWLSTERAAATAAQCRADAGERDKLKAALLAKDTEVPASFTPILFAGGLGLVAGTLIGFLIFRK
jgi:hypothetical protein